MLNPVTCPKCGIHHPLGKRVCDCGHRFEMVPSAAAAPPAAVAPPAVEWFSLAYALAGVCQLLAVLVGLGVVVLLALSWRTAADLGAAGWTAWLLQALYGTGAVVLLLAVGEGLNLARAIEANTRRAERRPDGDPTPARGAADTAITAEGDPRARSA